MNSNEESLNPREGGRGGRFGRGGRGRGGRWWKLAPLFIAVFVAVKAAAILVLWNALIPELFHGPELSYLQALGLTVLAKLLLGGGARAGFGGGRFGGFGGPGGHRGHWKERWSKLSPEDREKYREELRKRFDRFDQQG